MNKSTFQILVFLFLACLLAYEVRWALEVMDLSRASSLEKFMYALLIYEEVPGIMRYQALVILGFGILPPYIIREYLGEFWVIPSAIMGAAIVGILIVIADDKLVNPVAILALVTCYGLGMLLPMHTLPTK